MMDLFGAEERPVALVIDDEPAARLLAGALLEDMGFSVEQATDGLDGCEVFERHKPSLVLLDVVMPRMDGFTVCGKIRQSAYGEHIPILMMTGLDDIDSINKGYKAGATDFITKPINWTILRHRLRYIWRASLVSTELRRSEEKNLALINALPDLLVQIDRNGMIIDLRSHNGFDRVFSPVNLLLKKIEDVFPQQVSNPIMQSLSRALETGEMQFCEHKLSMDENHYFYEWRIVNSGTDEALAIVRDITGRKQTEERVAMLAYHDTLTGLLNRHSFKEHLQHAVEHARRYGRYVATLFLDIDRFKRINDTLGYNVGDLLLQGISERIQECVRRSDRAARQISNLGSSSISRLGGDEFTILLPEIKQVQDSAKVAKRILESLARPFGIAGHEVFVTGSIGITIYPLDGDDADTLLKNADAAMYNAKEQGRNSFQFYSASMNAASYKRLALETSLRKALSREEFLIYYQPQIDVASGKTVGMEALLRWRHPEIGLVPPMDFIPLAEETGLIIPIGEWVLCTACFYNKELQLLGLPPKRVAVNISSLQFRRDSLVKSVQKALEISGLDPPYLELELTESSIMKNMEESSRILSELKEMGLRVAIDDFGTGYSSLAYLKRFPLDVLKIDRSFLRDVPADQDNAAISTAIIAMAHSLNLKVVAEGVETEEQMAFLKDQGCDEAQGFLFSKALPSDEI
ncbi:MAG: EAL domain-containing protein, partial [Syntrophobacteraceae bacterium]